MKRPVKFCDSRLVGIVIINHSCKVLEVIGLTFMQNYTTKPLLLFYIQIDMFYEQTLCMWRLRAKNKSRNGSEHGIKETLLDLWTYSYDKPARAFFKKWYWWATHSRLKPVISVAKMLKNHLDNIMTYLKHRITNATAEGFNAKIQTIKSAARGFRNFENYRVSILFHCGKLNLYPQDSQ